MPRHHTRATATRARAKARERERRARVDHARVISPYDVLELPTDATPTEVKVGFRRRAKATHPDAAGDDGAAFRCACAAYEVLSDPARRSMVDDGIVNSVDGFDFVHGEVRTTLNSEFRTAGEESRSTRRRRKKTRSGASDAVPSAFEAKIASVPMNRDEIIARWRLRRAAAAWRSWCVAWHAALTYGAPLGVAVALAYAIQTSSVPFLK